MTENQKFVAKQIIIAIGVLGIASAVVVAPGLAKAIPLLRKINIARINQELKRLHKRGLVEIIKKRNGITTIKLTKEGKRKLARYKIDLLETLILGGSAAVNQVSTSIILSYGVKNPKHFLGVEFNLYSNSLI